MAKFLKENPLHPDVRNIFSSPTQDKAYSDRNCENTANECAEFSSTNTGVQSCVREYYNTGNNYLSFYSEGKIKSIDSTSSDIYSYAYGNGRMRYLFKKICNCQQNTYLSLGQSIGNFDKENVECSICGSQAVTTVAHTDTISIYGETELFQDLPQTSTRPRKSQYDNRTTNEHHDIHDRNTTDESRYTYMTPVSTSGVVGDCTDSEYDRVDDNQISLGLTTNGSCYLPAIIPESQTKIQSVCNRCRIILTIIMVVTIIAAIVIPVVLVRVNNSPAPDCIKCHPLSCPSYPAQLHGTVNDTADVLASSAVFISCTSGYMLNGSSVVRCLSNGTWEFISSCIPKNCGRYKTPPHASLATDNVDTTFNTTLRVVCDVGYLLAENSRSFVTCSENGNWTGDPICLNQVHLTVSVETIYIGGRTEISCSVTKVPGWASLTLGRTNRQNSSKSFVLIQKTVSYFNTSPISETHIRLSRRDLEEDSAYITLVFEPVQCTDALGTAGNLSFFCEVQYKNNILRNQNNATIIHRPTPPRMTLTPKIVEAQDTGLFLCEMEFPEPNGHIEIQTYLLHYGVFEPILNTSRGEYKTDIASIEDLKYTEENCSFHVKVEFEIKNISILWHRRQLRCVSYPSEISINKSILTSEVGLIKVIPGDVCSSKTDQSISHPYNCSLIVMCKGGVVSNILGGCQADQCFDAASNQCTPCSLVGGCYLTDIYFEVNNSRRNSFIVGSTVLIVCIIESFEGLTDIHISRSYGELVGSLQNGSNLHDFSIIQERSNLTHGSLVFEINPLKCADQTTYTCVPYGNGKKSEDVATLKLHVQGCL